MSERKILILDDELLIRRTLGDYFEDMGYEVYTAESGEEAIEIVKNTDLDFCTVDMRLPGMNGNDFIIKANALNDKIKFLIYTGSPDYVIPAEIQKIGVSNEFILQKPIEDINIIYEKLEKLAAK